MSSPAAATAEKTNTQEDGLEKAGDVDVTNNANDESAEESEQDEAEEQELDIYNEEEEEEQDDGEQRRPMTVDLSLMKSLYQFRERPTLASLLTEYGMEDKQSSSQKEKDRDSEKQKAKKKKKKNTFGDDYRDRDKERQQEEKHLQIVEDMKKLRDYYYEEYSQLLQNKVEQQREDIRKRSRAIHNKIAMQNEREREESHKVKKRVERHELSSDNTFLREIPKTDLYHIVHLQDKLIREGTLKSQTDLQAFWEKIQQPDIFYMNFNVPKSDVDWPATTTSLFNTIEELQHLKDMTRNNAGGMFNDFNDNASSKAASTMRTGNSPPPQGGPRALSRIAESREASRPNTRTGQNWAVTQQFPPQHKERTDNRRSSFTGLTVKTVPSQKNVSYMLELEKRFPKLEMPKLHCFTMSLGPKPPDPEEVRHEVHLHHLERNRKSYTHRLTKMHQLAMANAAAASRILEMHDDIDFIINGAPLQDLISDHHFYSGIPEKIAEKKASAAGPGPSKPPTAIAVLPSLKESRMKSSKSGSSQPSARTRSRNKRLRREKEDAEIDKQNQVHIAEPPPLTMADIKERSRIMDAKCLSTFWTNYTHTGGAQGQPGGGIHLYEPFQV